MSAKTPDSTVGIDLFAERDALERTGGGGDGECLSDFALDLLVAERSTSASAEAPLNAPAHLQACAACHARFDAFMEAKTEAAPTVARLLAAAQQEVDAEDQRATVESAPWWRRLWTAAHGKWTALPTAAAMAGAIAFALWPVPQEVPAHSIGDGNGGPVDVIRAKGTAVRFFVKRGDVVTLGKSGETFQAGDALRFVVTSGAPSNLLVFGVSASGTVSAYHPFGGVQSEPLRVGAEIPLSGSLVLDDAPQTEFLGAVFSPDPVRLDSVRAAVQSLVAARGTDATLDLEALHALDLNGAVHWIELQKEALASHTVDDREGAK